MLVQRHYDSVCTVCSVGANTELQLHKVNLTVLILKLWTKINDLVILLKKLRYVEKISSGSCLLYMWI